MTAGIVNPINPLLEPEKIAGILRETNAKVVVTLRAFPKTDLAQKVAEAVANAPNVKTVLEVDLNRYLTAQKLDRAADPAEEPGPPHRPGAGLHRRTRPPARRCG
jgi:acyl-CoA synthetase (AMP-forming)/AMP-acid ligase II